MSLSRQRQTQIYTDGVAGKHPVVPTSWPALKELARLRMTAEAFAYVQGGSGMEATMNANRRAFDDRRIVPRMLRGVTEADTTTKLLGLTLPVPMLLAPIGVLEMAHREADVAVARAAAGENIPMVFSSQASRSMEDCARAMDSSPRWFQLYWSKSDALTQSFVRRAEDCGCKAIVVTLDTTRLGWRPRDLDLGSLPFLRGMGIAQYVTDQVFLREVSEHRTELAADANGINMSKIGTLIAQARRHPGRTLRNLVSGDALAAVRYFVRVFSRPLSWEDIPHLRSMTQLPILLKGILDPRDATKAVKIGVDGVIVSNHGGRQVDGAIGAADALPNVVRSVDGAVPVLFDSGIRSGADIFKAIALGAAAVLIGRPYVYGLAIAGTTGVREVIQNLAAELELTMALAGCKDVAAVRETKLQ